LSWFITISLNFFFWSLKDIFGCGWFLVTITSDPLCTLEQVVLPLPHLRSVTPTTSQQNPAERCIQVVSVDNHEFWFMGLVNYDSAVKNLQEAARGVHGA
jgi:hypothetical protein